MSNIGNNDYLLSVQKPAPNKYQMGQGVMGSWDGKVLNPGGSSKWRHQPNNVPLNNEAMLVFQGTPGPLAIESQYEKLPNDSMFYFANNMVSLACCPSTYSTDRGCVCTTEQQRRFLGEQRGSNKNDPEYPTI